MNKRNTWLRIIALALAILLLTGCGSAPAQPAADFTGHWEGLSSNFILDLTQTGGQLQGSHSAVAQQGNKIDSLDKSLEGNIKGQVATVKFQSSFSTNSGEAQISFIDPNTIFWKVITPPDGEYYLPAESTLVKKTPAANPSPAASGTITGSVHLMAPPTPKMVVYAVEQMTGAWVFTETEATDGPATFSIVVPPGTYQVFGEGVGYSTDSLTLTSVTVAANQTVSGIEVRPPSQSDCGSTMGYPAAPDGRFAAIPGPSADCLASILTPTAPTSAPADAVRIQFQPNATMWQTLGDLAPNASIRFVLRAQKGQPMDVELTVPDLGAGPSASIYVWGADGQVFTPDLTTRWKGVLTVSQDYFIEVRSLSQQTINYSLLVAIPAVGSTPYVPVTLEVCKILQEMATQAIPTAFTLEASVPFSAPLTGEAGQSCNLTAHGTGIDFSDPVQPVTKLVSAFQGFTEQPQYMASGPTGYGTAVTRDMALVVISARWSPAPEAQCPSDQPISACNVTPQQKLYTIQIQAAMK